MSKHPEDLFLKRRTSWAETGASLPPPSFYLDKFADAAPRFAPRCGEISRPLVAPHGQQLEPLVLRSVLPRLGNRLPEPHCRENAQTIIFARIAIARMLALNLTGDSHLQTEYLSLLYRGGFSLAAIFDLFLTPLMHEIGRRWERDLMSFAQVSIFSARLQAALCEFLPSLPTSLAGRVRILLAAMPGEQHTLGLTMIAARLEEAGFTVDREIEATPEALCRRVAGTKYAAIGLSCGSDRTQPDLPGLASALRAASACRDVVMVGGGPALLDERVAAPSLHLDLIVRNGTEAVERLRTLTGMKSSGS